MHIQFSSLLLPAKIAANSKSVEYGFWNVTETKLKNAASRLRLFFYIYPTVQLQLPSLRQH